MEGDMIDNKTDGIVYDEVGDILYIWYFDEKYSRYEVHCCYKGIDHRLIVTPCYTKQNKVNEVFDFLEIRERVMETAVGYYNKNRRKELMKGKLSAREAE